MSSMVCTRLSNPQPHSPLSAYARLSPSLKSPCLLTSDVKIIFDDPENVDSVVRPALERFNHARATVIDVPGQSYKASAVQKVLGEGGRDKGFNIV